MINEEELSKVILKKDKSMLVFCFDDKRVKYDFNGNKFISYTGREIKPSTLKSQLRKREIDRENSNKDYLKLFDIVSWNKGGYDLTNIGTMVTNLYRYKDEEKYILQGFNITYSLDKYQSTCLSEMTKCSNKIAIRRQIPIRTFYQFSSPILQEFLKEFDLGLKDEDDEYFVELLEKIQYGYTLESIEYLIKHYKYKMKSLVRYILNIYNFEALNIRAIPEYLKDYMKMSKDMGVNKPDKYPRYLNTTHDVACRNYNDFEVVRDDSAFAKVIDNNLEYSNKTYSIVYPKSYKDIQKEGAEMHHCVASYVDRVLKGKCHIVFLRNTKKLNESVVTVEIKGNKITQYRGSYNRNLNKDEMDFLVKYAEVKNLKID